LNTFLLCFNLAIDLQIFHQQMQAHSWAPRNGLESTADEYILQAYLMNSVALDAFADCNSMHPLLCQWFIKMCLSFLCLNWISQQKQMQTLMHTLFLANHFLTEVCQYFEIPYFFSCINQPRPDLSYNMQKNAQSDYSHDHWHFTCYIYPDPLFLIWCCVQKSKLVIIILTMHMEPYLISTMF